MPAVLSQLIQPGPWAGVVIGLAGLSVATQAILARVARGVDWLTWLGGATFRLALATAFVGVASQLTGEGLFRPLAALYLPIVALAGAYGFRPVAVVGVVALATYVGPAIFIPAAGAATLAQRGLTLVAAGLILAVGARQTVASLEATLVRLRDTLAEGRRRTRQVAAVEAVGRVLAAHGPDAAALDQVMDLLHHRLGYSHVSLFLEAGGSLEASAQRGYAPPLPTFDGRVGVIGRVMRTHEAVFLPDVRADADFLAITPDLISEICVPLLAAGDLLGVVNVESGSVPLDETDLASILLVADRLASALALARERRLLADRADLFLSLTRFGASINASLDPDRLYPAIMHGVQDVLRTECVALTSVDRPTGLFRIESIAGGDPSALGRAVESGSTMAGRAIEERATVVDDAYPCDLSPVDADGRRSITSSLSVPLLHDDVVMGAITIVRTTDQPFSQTEREVLEVLGSQAALAVSNAFLLQDVTEASIRDSLTGLHNRRHLDASLGRMVAARQRAGVASRGRMTIILFDLDQFGAFNKNHGHQMGDTVLRGFGRLLLERSRASDMVARYGGEEFVMILENATLTDTVRVADEIRASWSRTTFQGRDGQPLQATVSAGCAELGPNGSTVEAMFAAADAALSAAKRGGRNLVIAA